MRALGVVLFLLGAFPTFAADSADSLPNIDCKALMRNVHGSLLVHSVTVEARTLDAVQDQLSEIQTVLKRNPTKEDFGTRGLGIPLLGKVFPDSHISRSQLSALQKVLAHIRSIQFFQSDMAAEYGNWVGQLIPRTHDTYKEQLKKLDPHYVPEPPKVAWEKYQGKTPEEWGHHGGEAALLRLINENENRWGVGEYDAKTRARLDKELLQMDELGFIPEFFMGYLREHRSLLDFYHVPRTRVYYAAIEELEHAYASALFPHD